MVLTTGRALGMFLVSLLYERKCLRIDLFKINFCLNVPFIIWFLDVLNSVTFVLRTPAATTRKEFSLFADNEATQIYAIVMGSCLRLLNFALFF